MADHAAPLSSFYDESHVSGKQKVVAILWDMEKFYDNNNGSKLIDKAKELGCPVLRD